MARKADAPVEQTPDLELLTTAPDDWEFETVKSEAGIKVVFEAIGESFIGQYEGVEHIVPDNGKDDPFDLLNFRGRDGNLYCLNTSYSLSEALQDNAFKLGDWVRITYKADIPSSKGNPMKSFRVDVRKN